MKDLNQMGMPIYAVPKRSKIRLLAKIKTPFLFPRLKIDDEVIFQGISGKFAICTNDKGKNCRLSKNAEVEIIQLEK